MGRIFDLCSDFPVILFQGNDCFNLPTVVSGPLQAMEETIIEPFFFFFFFWVGWNFKCLGCFLCLNGGGFLGFHKETCCKGFVFFCESDDLLLFGFFFPLVVGSVALQVFHYDYYYDYHCFDPL